MPEGLWVIALFVAAFLVYVVAWVVFYVRKSNRQWKEVDRSKLKEWKDDDW